MRSARLLSRRLSLAPLLALLALGACGDDDGTGVTRLTTEEVGGSYRICSLNFVPAGGFPEPVDVLALIEPDFSRLELSNTQRQFNLLYRLRSGGLSQTAPGTYELGASTVELQFSASQATAGLLLPTNRRLPFTFQADPKQLTPPDSPATYAVAKSDYETLTGRSYPNLSNQIQGTLSGRFTTGSCT